MQKELDDVLDQLTSGNNQHDDSSAMDKWGRFFELLSQCKKRKIKQYIVAMEIYRYSPSHYCIYFNFCNSIGVDLVNLTNAQNELVEWKKRNNYYEFDYEKDMHKYLRQLTASYGKILECLVEDEEWDEFA